MSVESRLPPGSLLTALFVELDLCLKLGLVRQRPVDCSLPVFVGVLPVEELASTALLHDLSPGKSGELAEAVRAVHDGEGRGHLGVAQHKVAVCKHEDHGPESSFSTRSNNKNKLHFSWRNYLSKSSLLFPALRRFFVRGQRGLKLPWELCPDGIEKKCTKSPTVRTRPTSLF